MVLANTVSINLVDPIVEATGASWMVGTNLWGILLRLFMAFIFATILGVERSVKKHTAGLRTYILVCVGSTIAIMVNEYLVVAYGTGDVGRLGAQVISGIGFLGAGTILVTSRNQVKGLTTAAGLWANACLGLCIGAGFYTVAIVGFVIISFTIFFMPRFEKRFTKKGDLVEIHVEFEARPNLKEFVAFIREKGFKVESVEHNPAYSQSGLSVYTIMIENKNKGIGFNHESLIQEIRALPYVNFIEEI